MDVLIAFLLICSSESIFRSSHFHVAAFVHDLQKELSPPSVTQHLAAIRMLFDWLVTGHVIETNPAHSVRGPRYTIKIRSLMDSVHLSDQRFAGSRPRMKP